MLRLALLQLDLTVGALEENCDRIAQACTEAAAAGADVALAPELAISGYPPEDLLLRPAFLEACRASAESLADRAALPLIVGTPWLAGDRVHNSAVVLANGAIAHRYDKQELPNYGVFDEQRTFAAGRESLFLSIAGAVCAVTICEDIWLAAGPAESAARAGATVILNISSSPYELGKDAAREQMMRTRARDHQAFIVYANLVGGQDELVFDGRSMVLSPDGELVARADAFTEEVLVCDVNDEEAVALRLRDTRMRRGQPVAAQVAGTIPAAAAKTPLPRRVAAATASPEEDLWRALRLGVADYVNKNGFGRVLVGVSGGVDSALVAALAADALGPDRVEAVSMPTRYNQAATRSDARRVAEALGVAFRELDIEALREAFMTALPDTSGLAAENVQARIRGLILMTLSNQYGWLVLTTSNKSETAVGFSTLYGDTAGGFAPIRDVPKTMVFRLARYINSVAGKERIPLSVIERPPSAELRDDQRDDQSLPPYETLDAILEAYVEQDLSGAEITRRGLGDAAMVSRVARLVDRAEYKRRQAPPGLKLAVKAFGRDRRVPITNRFDR